MDLAKEWGMTFEQWCNLKSFQKARYREHKRIKIREKLLEMAMDQQNRPK
jgi:hypothetical protein